MPIPETEHIVYVRWLDTHTGSRRKLEILGLLINTTASDITVEPVMFKVHDGGSVRIRRQAIREIRSIAFGEIPRIMKIDPILDAVVFKGQPWILADE